MTDWDCPDQSQSVFFFSKESLDIIYFAQTLFILHKSLLANSLLLEKINKKNLAVIEIQNLHN